MGRIFSFIIIYYHYYISDCKPKLGEQTPKTQRSQQGRQPSKERENCRKKIKRRYPSDISDTNINEDDAGLINGKINTTLIEELNEERKHRSLFVLSSFVGVQDAINSLHDLDIVISASIDI